jgi:hypothetical protein
LAARDVLRQEQARPLLDQIKPAIESARGAALPSGKLGNATAYTLTLWEKLTRFLEYPELELSTNPSSSRNGWENRLSPLESA